MYISLPLTHALFFSTTSLSLPTSGRELSKEHLSPLPSSVGSVASPCNQVIIRWFVRAIMSVATSVAALVASRGDRDRPARPARVPPVGSCAGKFGPILFRRLAALRKTVEAFSALSRWCHNTPKLTAVTEVENRDLLLPVDALKACVWLPASFCGERPQREREREREREGEGERKLVSVCASERGE